MEDFIKIFENQGDQYRDLNLSLKILDFLKEYQEISKFNSDLIIKFIKLVRSLNSILNYNIFLKRKTDLLNELELAKNLLHSNELAAKTDLMNKLSKSIKENKKILKYKEEDFLFLKNKIDQLRMNKKNLNLEIKELNRKKKECFNQINKITRDMSEESSKNQKDKLNLTFYNEKNSSKSEKIKDLQKSARDFQYKINEIKSKLSNSQLKFNEINPKFENLENDYSSLLKVIRSDEKRLNQIRGDIEERYMHNGEDSKKKIDLKDTEFIKSPQEIENELQIIDNSLTRISESNNQLNKKNPHDLERIIKELKEIEEILKNYRNRKQITNNMNEISNSINNFRQIEILNQNLEEILNKFLNEVNLETNFQIVISNDNSSFSLNIEFIRSNKVSVSFEELTTPEKIFFLIMLNISIQIHLNYENIIFSNLILPNDYNKRGSIFRTIRKIIPVFEKESYLKNIKLVFIISNLEMKKPIENIEIIRID